MIVKNNYQECLTNLACSIKKYFGLEYKHNTLDYIDKILEEKKPKNVVTILCDGMGSNIMDKCLNEFSFLINHRIKTITTVFPATTVAATTSMITGLNPCETGMLGWDIYFKEIDKTITTYLNFEKGDPEKRVLQEAIDFKKRYMITKSITDEINEVGIDNGYMLFPFGSNPYNDLDDMFNSIVDKCNEPGRKYIYAYSNEPDETMHDLGCDAPKVYEIIKKLNIKIEEVSKKLTDTIIFVVADHGHINVENLFLKDYPLLVDCLEKNTSIESRAINFFIKENKKEEFVSLFNEYFKDYFELYNMNDVIESKLFGNGEENTMFRDALGDYLAIAKADKTLLYGGNSVLKSQHAGYTYDEIYVPLIVIDTDKVDNNTILNIN